MKRTASITLAVVIAGGCVPEGRGPDQTPGDRARNEPGAPAPVAPGPPATPGQPMTPPPTTPPPPDLTLEAIDVTPAKPAIPYGTTQQFAASGRFSDGQRYAIDTPVQWRSSDETLVGIEATGLATGLGQGTVTIAAMSQGIEGTTTLTVGPPGLVGVTISPEAPTLVAGSTQQFLATAERADGSTEDVTTAATWASSAPGVLTVDASGLATVVGAGAAEVTASHAGFDSSAAVTIDDCAYPSGSTDLRLGSLAPRLSWHGVYDEAGNQLDFSLEDFHCNPAFERYNTAMFIIGTGWCPNCPAYFRRVGSSGAQIKAAGGLVVYVEAEDRNYRPATNSYAQSHVDSMVGSSPGLRVGDGETMPARALYNAPLVRAFPTAFVIRKRDMRIIADQGSSNSTLQFTSIAQNPDHDWSSGQLPPPFNDNCGAGDEEMYEPNDQSSQAAAVLAGSFQAGICTDAPDFYRVDIAGAWTIDLHFSHAVGDIDLYVWDPTTQDILRNGSGDKVGSDSNTDDERYSGNGPTTIMIRGYRGASAPYTFTLTGS